MNKLAFNLISGTVFAAFCIVFTGCSGEKPNAVKALSRPVATTVVPVTPTHSELAPESIVKLAKNAEGDWQLLRGGKPYQIKGAGGDAPLDLLVAAGANSNRHWGVGDETQKKLDEAHAKGVTVALGIWLEHPNKGFDYNDYDDVTKQVDAVLTAVKKYKNHPAVLMWGIGNEMENAGSGEDPAIWSHVEFLANQIKKIDPNHPVMTVIAEIGGRKVPAIHKLAPSVDIIGINAYGGVRTLGERYRQMRGTKPYIVTEFGPLGTWEVGKNSLDAIDEKTSTEKSETYRGNYEAIVRDTHLCLGSYVFLWGQKQEATATWFGMFTKDGKKTAAVDVMTELWSGKKPENLCPTIESLTLVGSNAVKKSSIVKANLKASDPEGKPINVNWMLMKEADNYFTAGDFQEEPPTFPSAIVKSSKTSVEVKMPEKPGLYRLYAYVDDGENAAATGNISLRIEGAVTIDGVTKAQLPFTFYDEPEGGQTTYVPSGFMGSHDAISVMQNSTNEPKSGAHCMKCSYSKPDNWGGVVWQSPENDWGELNGGLNLSGATKMTFWARGKDGGEAITFGIGVLGRDKKFYDTAKKEIKVELTKDWKQYTIDLSGQNLERIKSGFFWSLPGQGKPLTFYLDDMVFE